MEKEIPMYILTQKQIDHITAIAVNEAINAFRKEQMKIAKKQAKEKNKVEKTKKMLKSYRRIKTTLTYFLKFNEAYFFLFATVLLGPLRVLALVLVF